MIELQNKINSAFRDLETNSNEDKVIISIVGKIDRTTLKSTTFLLINGNQVSSVKILRELLKDNRASNLSLILEEIKEYL
jgi:hypothetical protein